MKTTTKRPSSSSIGSRASTRVPWLNVGLIELPPFVWKDHPTSKVTLPWESSLTPAVA